MLHVAGQTCRPGDGRDINGILHNYSDELKTLLRFCANPQLCLRDIDEIVPMIGSKFYPRLRELEDRLDWTEIEMNKEMENGR